MAEKMGNIKRYPCILCGQEGFTEHQMKAHIALEHFESDAACPFCNTRCQCPAHLIRHINKNHPEIFGPSSPEQNRNISAFQHSRTGSKRQSKQTHSVECCRQDGENDASTDEPSRFDPVGIPTTQLSSLGKNNGCKCDCDDGKDCSSDSSLNTDEVNKLMIGKIRASGGSEHPKRSGATHSETCAGKCRVTDAAPGKYFFERDRSAAREKKPLGECRENHGYQKQSHQKHGRSSAQRKNLNIISDDSDSDEQIVSRREVSRGVRGSYECCEAVNTCIERCKQSSSDVKKPPFEDPVHRQDKARHEKSHRDREEQNDIKGSSKRSSPCKQHEFNCPICPFGTDCRQTIIAHVQDMHAEELDGTKDCGCHICPVCSKKFPCPETLQSHVHAVHKDILKTPESKRKRSERPGQPKVHSGVSVADSDPTGLHKKQGADCGARAKVCCSKSSACSDPKSSSDHLMSCQLCGIIVNNKEDLLQHLAWAHPEPCGGVCGASAPQKTYCCLLCDAEFGNRDELQNHVQKIHSQGQAGLPDGAAARESQEKLQLSKRMSSQDSQGKALGLNRSSIQDTQERKCLPSRCCLDQRSCSLQAQSAMLKTQSGSLTSKASSSLPRDSVHEGMMVGSNPSKASRSILRGSMNEGMMVGSNSSKASHSLPGDSMNECTVCKSHFPSKDDLMRHLVWVHGGGPSNKEFICNQCHTYFSSEKALQDHKQAIHFPNAMKERPSLIRSRNTSVDILHHRQGSQVHRHSVGNMSASNQRSLLNEDAEIIDAVCPVCQKPLPRVSMAGFQAHVNSHFEESQELGESSHLRYCQIGSSGKDFWSSKRYNTMIAHIRGPLEVDQGQYQHHCFPHSKEPGLDDGISRTDGIIERLQEYFRPALPDNVAHVWMCASISHYASTAADRGWGCGYRNFQMMMSCLLDRREYYAALLQGGDRPGGDKAEGSEVPNSQARPGYMPSIGRIQAMLEEAWREGFDPEGRDQLEGVVFDTCKWIGATELVAILSHCGIKTKLTDFPQPTGPNGTHPALFKWVLNYFTSPTAHVRPPLYLQHQGHSRTIIGIEQLNSGELRLLVFDPGKEPKLMDRFKWNLNTTTVNMLRRSLHALKAKQYQVMALDGFLTEDEREASKIIRSERIM